MKKLFFLAFLVAGFFIAGCENTPSTSTTDTTTTTDTTGTTAITPDTTSPGLPTGLTAIAAGDAQINLSWTSATDDTSPSASILYEVCQGQAAGSCDSFTVTGTTLAGVTTYNATGLNPNTFYYFKVRAVDAAGNIGSPTAEVNSRTDTLGTVNAAVFTPPAGIYGSPQNVILSSATAGAAVCYTSDGVTDPSCNAATGGCFIGLQYPGVPLSIPGTQTLKAIACKIDYNPSVVLSADYIIDAVAPSAPTGLTAAAAGYTQIDLNWVASTDNVSSPANLVYEICQSLIAGGCDVFSVSYTTGAGATTYNVSGLLGTATYYFRIRAKDEAGNFSAACAEGNGTALHWVSIYAGDAAHIVRSDGTLWAWGNNYHGQLGVGDTITRASPVQVGTSTTWASTSSGSYTYQQVVAPGDKRIDGFTLGLQTDGTLWAWGMNDQAQLGLGDYTNRTSPVQIGTATTWSFVSAGSWHGLAMQTDGTLWAWGANYNGQLGLGDTVSRTSPVQIGTATTWSSVSAGQYHSMAIQTNGSLWAWGSNGYGQLGLGDTANRTSPVQVGTATNWASVSAGVHSTLAVKTDGTLWAWGSNSKGQLGLGDTVDRNVPVQVGTATNWKSVETGGYQMCINPSPCSIYGHAIAVKTDGTLWAWGSNYTQQLGLGDNVNRTSPVQVGTAANWSYISAGLNHNLAIQADGTLWSWGIFQDNGLFSHVLSNDPSMAEVIVP